MPCNRGMRDDGSAGSGCGFPQIQSARTVQVQAVRNQNRRDSIVNVGMPLGNIMPFPKWLRRKSS